MMKHRFVIATSIIVISAFAALGAVAQTTGPAAQDPMKPGTEMGTKKDMETPKGTTPKTSKKKMKPGAESKDGDGMPKGGMSK
jgi:hypothetical protein